MNNIDLIVSANGFNYIAKSSYFESKHKSRPSQFTSIAEGRLKRTERKSLHRKSARTNTFDNARNMSPLASSAPTLTSNEAKSNRRRHLLQQWKEEKDRKKQEAFSSKKKPFLVGAIRAPPSLEDLPAVPKPSTSGRVTRSQSVRKHTAQSAPSRSAPSTTAGRVVVSAADFFAKTNQLNVSFAPANAVFHPPQNLAVPLIFPAMAKEKRVRTKATKQTVTFEPIVKVTQANNVPKSSQSARAQKANEPSLSRKRNQLTQQKAADQRNLPKSTGQLKSGTQSMQHVPAGKAFQLQSAGASAPKDNNINTRMTRRNTRLIDKDKLSEIKPAEAKIKEAKKKIVNVKPKKDINLKENNTKNLKVRSQNTPKKNHPKSESRSEEKLRTPPQDKSLTPEQIRAEVASMSPLVTVSRGKANARVEMLDKLKDGRLADDVGDEKAVNHFRSQLKCEITRLTAVSDDWHKYAEDNILPEHIQEMVLAAVGQTRLLMSKKLQQFSQLVEQCASGEPRPEGCVTTTDLQGFWDMVFMQVENVDMRFKQLSDLRERQWVSDEKAKPKKKAAAKSKARPAPAAAAPSRIRAMIEAARKAAQQKAPTNVLLSCDPSGNKDFDAGFFTVTSPVRGAAPGPRAPRTPLLKSPSLLKNVLSSEARKANKGSVSHAMMRASIIAKTMDQEQASDVERSPWPSPPAINLDATPARSILKTPNVAVKASGRRKSAKTVLFSEADEPEKPLPLSPTAGFQKIAVSPEKTPEKSSKRRSAVRNSQKLARSPALDQENVEPEETPSRRITRAMRQSLLSEGAATPLVSAGQAARARTSSARNSARLTEVH